MEWDLGPQGLGVLTIMALGFGVFAHLVAARYTTRWVGLVGAIAFFVAGLLISEAWFGWATEEELQPNIDGLSFDEVLLLGFVPGIVAVLIARRVGRRRLERREPERREEERREIERRDPANVG